MLQVYYQNLAAGEGACGFVADHDSTVVGFVCGVWNFSLLKKRLLQKYGFRLAVLGVRALIQNPSLLANLASRLRSNSGQLPSSGYELRPIAVDAAFRGSGAAARLVHCLLEDAARKGFREINLFTEEDNPAAQRFYQKMGFQEAARLNHSGRVYLQFSRSCQ